MTLSLTQSAPHGAPVTWSLCLPPKCSEEHPSFKTQKLFPSIEVPCSLSPPLQTCSPWEEVDAPDAVQRDIPPHGHPSLVPCPSTGMQLHSSAWPGPAQPFEGLLECHLRASCLCPAQPRQYRSLPLWTTFSFCLVFWQAWHGLWSPANTASPVRLSQPPKLKRSCWPLLPGPTGHHSKILLVIAKDRLVAQANQGQSE